MKNVNIINGNGLNPVITDDFILIPNPRKYDPAKTYEIKFTAEKNKV